MDAGMTLGDKIRKYRTLKGLTQKELGLKVGFSAATADSRIRKYEKDLMAPKIDIRKRIADALNVDLSALSDIDIHSDEDIMQVLFFLEEACELEIERTLEETRLIFRNDNANTTQLISYLYSWYIQKKNLPSDTDESYHDAKSQYQAWQARFPRDLKDYWKSQTDAINDMYKSSVDEMIHTREAISELSEFTMAMRKLIEARLTMYVSTTYYGVGDGGLVISFLVSELLDNYNERFAEFLFNIETMKGYGMPYYIDLSSGEEGTRIAYTLRWSVLTPSSATMIRLIEHEKNKVNMSDLEIDTFEKMLETDLRNYNVQLETEIALAYPKQEKM